jgi:hypothetical protein
MITCYTLCDITHTSFIRKPKDSNQYKLRNQERNFETFIQLISLRNQPTIIAYPKLLADINIENYQFGSYFMPSVGFTYRVWYFKFDIEHITSNIDYSYHRNILVQDFNDVPILTNLEETARIPNTIVTTGALCNTYFI